MTSIAADDFKKLAQGFASQLTFLPGAFLADLKIIDGLCDDEDGVEMVISGRIHAKAIGPTSYDFHFESIEDFVNFAHQSKRSGKIDLTRAVIK